MRDYFEERIEGTLWTKWDWRAVARRVSQTWAAEEREDRWRGGKNEEGYTKRKQNGGCIMEKRDKETERGKRKGKTFVWGRVRWRWGRRRGRGREWSLYSKDPGIPARSILESSRMLHSHSPLFRAPSVIRSSLSSLFLFSVVNMLHSVLLSGFIPRKGNHRLLQTRKGVPLRGFLSHSLSLSLLPPFFLTDLDAARFFSLSPSPSFYAPQDLGTLGLRNQGLFEEPKVVERIGIFASSTPKRSISK